MRAFGSDVKIGKRLAQMSAGAAVAVATFVSLPSPAQALPFPPSPRDVHRRVAHDVRRVLELPRAIHHAHVDAFRSFYRGRVYFPAHHHYHAVYNYPVYYGRRVFYRPYYYCNDSLFITRGVPVPRIVVNVRPDGYYYAPGPPPPPAPRYYDRGYDDRYHDRYDRDRDRYDRDYDRDDDNDD